MLVFALSLLFSFLNKSLGRTYPVQEFFLEDVLTMTGFVNDSGAYFSDTMGEVEAELASLLNQGRRGDATLHESSLSCIMCNMTGFTSPEELGTHIALCDGGKLSALALEEKVRRVDVSVTSMAHTFEPVIEYVSEPLQEEPESQVDDIETEELYGLKMGKWDGESPFAVADNLEIGTSNTLTEDEMLNRYQTIHDDQQVDDELILEVIKYICKSSYGDGAILVFLPG